MRACSRFHTLLATLATSVLLALVPPPAFASDAPDERARVLGSVLTEGTRVPVPGVTVEVEGTGLGTITDSRGHFALTGLPQDRSRVALRFSRIGFEGRTVEVDVRAGTTVRVDVELTPRAVALDPLSVLLERTRMLGDPVRTSAVPGSAFHLDRRDLDARPLAFDNIHDVLRQVPGVTVHDEEGYGLRPHIGLRGAGSERSSRVTLMEDGVLIAPAPYAAPAAYYFPATGRLDGIEVRKGASQIRYGPHTLGGAVNLLTAPVPDRRSWLVDAAGGEDRMLKSRVRVGDSGRHVGWLLEGFHVRTDGFKELQGGGDTGFETRDLMAKVRFNSDRESPRYQELEIKFGISDHMGHETYLGLTESDFRLQPTLRYAGSQVDRIDTDHRQLQARWFRRLGSAADVVVTAYRNDFARNWYKLQSVGGASPAGVLADPDAHAGELGILQGGDSGDDALVVRANNREYLSQGLEAQFGFRFGTGRVRHDLLVGARLHEDHEDRLQWEDGYRMTSGRMVRTSEGAPGTQANRLSEAGAVALFLQDEIRGERWALVPGLRYESVDFTRTDWAGTDPTRVGVGTARKNSVDALIPGVSATWEWNPWTHLFAGIHRGFGPPGPGADAETRPERSVNYESGVRIRRAGVGANVTGFYSDYENILGRATLATGESGSGELFNGGQVEVYGVEAAVDLDLSRYLSLPLRLPVRAAYTFTRGSFLNSFESGFGPWGEVEAGDRLPYLPEHLFSGRIGVEDAGWRVALDWSGAGTMRTEAGRGPIPEGSGADRFVVFGLSGQYSLGPRGVIYGGVQNLTDRSYVVSRRPAGARPGLPRTFFLGVRIEG